MALGCCGIPFLFWKYGAKIREKSKYAYAGDDDDSVVDEKAAKGLSDEENQIGAEAGRRFSGVPPLAAGPAP